MILELTIKWLVPFVLASTVSLVVFVIKWLRDLNKTLENIPKQIETVQKGLATNNKKISDLSKLTVENDLAMLWSQLTGKCQDVIKKGYCDIPTIECINQLFARYQKIGGNHGVEALVKQARSVCEKKEK